MPAPATPTPASLQPPAQGISGAPVAPPAVNGTAPLGVAHDAFTSAVGQRAQQAAAGQVDPVTASLLPPGASPGLIQPASGGKALTQMIHRQQFGGPAPTDAEMSTAFDDITADGLVHPFEADAAHMGGSITPAFANTAAHRVQWQRGLPSSWSPSGSMNEAKNNVSNALGSTPSAGPQGASSGATVEATPGAPQAGLVPAARPPVFDPIRWQAARADQMAHADDMAGLAPTQGEKQAILSIKGTKSAAAKQAILDRYRVANPGADTSRFTPQLMKGF